MAQRLYFGPDTDPNHRKWLESTQKQLRAELALGKRTTFILAAGVKTEKKIEVSVKSALYQVEHDLCVLYPADYDPSVLMPIKHVRPLYLFN